MLGWLKQVGLGSRELWSKASLSSGDFELLEASLYRADFGPELTASIVELMRGSRNAEVLAERLGASLREHLKPAVPSEDVFQNAKQPMVICLVGVNGSGKTTTAGKLAKHLRGRGKTVLLGACDTFRAAAQQQLAFWADALEVELVRAQQGADAAAVAFDAYAAAVHRKLDVLILDTAGRLHNSDALMRELAKIKRVLRGADATMALRTWMVVDGSMGLNALQQAKAFHAGVGLEGLIITKLDGSARGGALFGMVQELGVPVEFVGLGEGADDIKAFNAEDYTAALLAALDLPERV